MHALELPSGPEGGEIYVGGELGALAITPNGRTAYVTDLAGDSVTPVGAETSSVGARILVGEAPDAVAVTPNGKTVYVANLVGNSVTPIDVATNKAGTEIPVGTEPAAVAFTPDSATAYVATPGSNTVTPIKSPRARPRRKSKWDRCPWTWPSARTGSSRTSPTRKATR